MTDAENFSVDFGSDVITVGRVYNSIRMIIEPKDSGSTAIGMVVSPSVISNLMNEIRIAVKERNKDRTVQWEVGEGINRYNYSFTFSSCRNGMITVGVGASRIGDTKTRTITASVQKFSEFYKKLNNFRAE